ncbi:MAG: hypothetical protein D4S01_01830 [Dehalococcoidia bacterium]|jgi:uncharacterized protein YwgA|nr:MAG: hypothetical protein D4S01_01830 [Dehalococcoidia bacterium]
MSLTKLLSFVKFLESKADFRFDVEKFEHRLMLQKYVYIAKFFGLNLGYPYSIYLRGPYSSALADDYYELAGKKTIDYEGFNEKELGGLNAKKLLEVIEGKNSEWLEIAATILSVHNRYRMRYFGDELADKVLSTSCDIKSTISSEKISGVFEYLKNVGLLVV